MNILGLTRQLAAFPDLLDALVGGLTDDDVRWRPEPDAWSILEVVCHLVDEECDDFRKRVRLTLEDPGTPWPPIDPEAAAVERSYADQDLAEQLQAFRREREASIGWLKGLVDADWDSVYQHPKVGPVPAGVVMGSWVAHDALHLRQIAKRRYQIANRDAAPYVTDYAGEW